MSNSLRASHLLPKSGHGRDIACIRTAAPDHCVSTRRTRLARAHVSAPATNGPAQSGILSAPLMSSVLRRLTCSCACIVSALSEHEAASGLALEHLSQTLRRSRPLSTRRTSMRRHSGLLHSPSGNFLSQLTSTLRQVAVLLCRVCLGFLAD